MAEKVEMGVQEELLKLHGLRERISRRMEHLLQGGVPMGARPGMGSGVGPDRPPVVPQRGGLLV
ncbi:hypothetical protein CL673_09745 [Candidatus Bathyarchaeota archaeon]|nr:hypothetical protein [Candidatus Bathyarchaeota archaeon]